MKKRLLSILLAALLALPTAFAAEGDTIGDQAAKDSTLVFTATLPDTYNVDFMGSAVAEQVISILNQRLELLGYTGASVEAADENRAVSITLPVGADLENASVFLSAPGKLSCLGPDGAEVLTGDDVAKAEAVPGTAEDYTILLTLTTDGQGKLSKAAESASEDSSFTFLLDGDKFCDPLIPEKPVKAQLTLSSPDFTESFAKTTAEIINIGPLPVSLTPESIASTTASTDPAPIATDAETPPATSETTDESTPETPPATSDPAIETSDAAFPDIAGHWAQESLEKAVELGLLNGADDGTLKPDSTIKLSEALVMLNRALGASKSDPISGMNVPADAWYAGDIGKALHLGLISPSDKRNFNNAATRVEAFMLLTRAFSYDGVLDLSVLNRFTDTAGMTNEQKNATAALVSTGVINGLTETELSPNGQITRAQFITMILRAAPDIISDAETLASLKGSALITVPSVDLTGPTFSGNQVFSCATSSVSLSGAGGTSRIVLKGSENVTLYANTGSTVGVLTLDPSGSANVSFDQSSSTNTLVIPGRGGPVDFSGNVDAIQITSAGRNIDISGINARAITVTGIGNTITVNGNVTTIDIREGADNNVFIINGSAQAINVASRDVTLKGSGKAGTITNRYTCNVNLASDSRVDNSDTGLQGVKVTPGVPTRVVPGGSLSMIFKFTNVKGTKMVRYQWYQDGKPVVGSYTPSFAMSEGSYVHRITTFDFHKGMQTSVTMGLLLVYANPDTGKEEKIFTDVTVPIDNYSDEWYYQHDAQRILNLVSSTYRGNYTTSYAVNNDYSSTEKEVWINAKGYSSNTQYLCWINRAYQHVNVFSGSKGNWKLVKSFIVGTGASGTPTPTGLTHVTYKSQSGWTTSTYTVRPVIGFYPNTGYAFHSRLCYPGTTKEYDFSSGYPVSHGCVRMLRSDIDWMYKNIPVGTTVVIF